MIEDSQTQQLLEGELLEKCFQIFFKALGKWDTFTNIWCLSKVS